MKLKSMIILCGLVAAGCAACSREIQPAGERNIPEGQVRVVMPVQAGQMACVTRAADEDTVNDLNVYLFRCLLPGAGSAQLSYVYGAGI